MDISGIDNKQLHPLNKYDILFTLEVFQLDISGNFKIFKQFLKREDKSETFSILSFERPEHEYKFLHS